ncbi:MAG TPA: PH domain-containing protein [Candidatus Limnocylindrales bacterium]|nr:PH domain-containing protein [Candidatus Limnocylindrales bacterium]
MAYVDSMLASNEQITRRDHQHWFVLVADARYGILAIIVAILLLVLRGVANTTGNLDTVIGWVVLALVIAGIAYTGWQILRWMNEEYVVTTRRVLQAEGVVNKRVTDSSLEKINDAILTQSLFGRIFGFGDLDILTASEAGISRLRMLRQADDFKRAMLDAKHELELELSGGRPLPSPPMRAAPPAPPIAPAPASAPLMDAAPPAETHPAPPSEGAAAPSTRSDMSPEQLTATLASLADLRDRGAISAEEYEAKKADLLRRL